MSEHLEVVRFTVRPGERDQFLARRDAAIAALRERFPGLIDGHLAEYDDGSWIDVLRWRTREEAEAAAAGMPELEAAREWVAHIDEVKDMRHAAIRHTVESPGA